MRELKRWQENKISDPRASIWVMESTWVSILGIVISLTMLSAAILQHTILSDYMTTFGCKIQEITSVILLVLFGLCLIIVGVGLFFMKHFPDPYHIKYELITCFVTWILTLGPYLALSMTNSEQFYSNCCMFAFIISGYFTSVVTSIALTYRAPPEPQTPEKILDTPEQIIMDPEGYELVMQVLIQKSAQEMPPFLKAVLEFKEINDQNTQLKKVKSQEIYVKHISKDAPLQVNISAAMRNDIESRMDNPTTDMFNNAYREVLKLVRTNFLKEIKNLPAYQALVQKREEEIQKKKISESLMRGNNK